MRPTPDLWITRIDEATRAAARARDRETIEIEYLSAARGRRRLVGDELLADDFVDSARGTRQGVCRTPAVRSGNARNVSSHQSRARCFDMVAEDDLVATYKTFTGTHAGTFWESRRRASRQHRIESRNVLLPSNLAPAGGSRAVTDSAGAQSRPDCHPASGPLERVACHGGDGV
jgi:hypothetical protein